ncbi:extensin family protein [Pseudooceanicola aestuarii]|uniref:extensin-like domain-containing protein n=1 Tax=Pseudooceanicola aestuarii TaxID=2697319 RepID=UPI0013D23AE5|nr:extensin family protein [Pseudooceanicola aestuarii]
MRRALLLLACLVPVVAGANAPETSLRPVARGQLVQGKVLPADVFVRRDLDQPRSVPEVPASAADRRGGRETYGVEWDGRPHATLVFRSLRPRARPSHVVQQARAVSAARVRGQVCGDPALQGVPVGRIPGKVAGCGVQSAIRLQSVSGVALSTHSVMDCGTAQALKSWVDGGLKPAVKGYGGGVSSLRVVAHYSCRTRNNRKGAKISEHGKGRAIDIAGIKLKDGSELTVLTDWSDGRKGRILHKAHASACGPFGTVLGPDANVYHRDHFHFDTARYRSGSYCR